MQINESNSAVLDKPQDYSDLGTEIVVKEDYSDLGVEIIPNVGELKKAPPSSFIDTIKSFFKSPEEDIAKAQNVYALSEVTGLDLKDTYNNYDVLRRTSKVTGLSPDLESREYLAIAMTPFIATAAVTNPIGTAAGLLAYGALDKAIPTEKIVEGFETAVGGELSSSAKSTIELLDFVGKGLIVGGVFKKAPKLAEGFLKNKLVEYNMSKEIKLSAEQVRDIYQTGKLTTMEEQSLFGSLNLKGAELRATLTEGVKISIPPEKLVSLVDKPIWAKLKSVIGMESKPQVVSEMVGKPQKAVSGLIEGEVAPTIPPIKPQEAQAEILPTGEAQQKPVEGKLPIVEGEGETKIRGLAQGVEAKAIENKLTNTFGELPEYKTVNMKEQASKAQDLLIKEPERAKRIAMGEELSPQDILPESLFVAVENKAVKEGDVATLRDLAVSSGLTAEATTMGQRIRTLAERDPESPVTAIKEVSQAREQAGQRKLKTKETKKIVQDEVASIKEHIKKIAPTKETWADFIRSIQC